MPQNANHTQSTNHSQTFLAYCKDSQYIMNDTGTKFYEKTTLELISIPDLARVLEALTVQFAHHTRIQEMIHDIQLGNPTEQILYIISPVTQDEMNARPTLPVDDVFELHTQMLTQNGTLYKAHTQERDVIGTVILPDS